MGYIKIFFCLCEVCYLVVEIMVLEDYCLFWRKGVEFEFNWLKEYKFLEFSFYFLFFLLIEVY